MNQLYPNVRRRRKPMLPVEPVPPVCPHCGRSSTEPVKPAAELFGVTPERTAVTAVPPPKADDAENAPTTKAK